MTRGALSCILKYESARASQKHESWGGGGEVAALEFFRIFPPGRLRESQKHLYRTASDRQSRGGRLREIRSAQKDPAARPNDFCELTRSRCIGFSARRCRGMQLNRKGARGLPPIIAIIHGRLPWPGLSRSPPRLALLTRISRSAAIK